MNHLRAIFLILFMLFVIILAVQNHEAMSTSVKFRVDLVFLEHETSEMSLYLVVVITFLVGVILSGVCGIAERFRLKRQIKTLMSDAKGREKELNSLRNLPVTTEDMGSNKTSDI